MISSKRPIMLGGAWRDRGQKYTFGLPEREQDRDREGRRGSSAWSPKVNTLNMQGRRSAHRPVSRRPPIPRKRRPWSPLTGVEDHRVLQAIVGITNNVAIRLINPDRRHMTVSAFSGHRQERPTERSLTENLKKNAGRSYGPHHQITPPRRRNRRNTIIDFKRDKDSATTVINRGDPTPLRQSP